MSSEGMKVWLLYITTSTDTVEALPFSSLAKLERHKTELEAKFPGRKIWFDPRPEVVL
jgi:hypothetical protein